MLKNIIFDFGGVLFDIDYNLTIDAFSHSGVPAFREMYNQYTADKLFADLERGHISEEDFYREIHTRSEGVLNSENAKSAWNAMLLDFRVDSFRFLQELNKDYNLYLLSNTNIIHKTAFDEIFRRKTSFGSIDEFFIKAWYSHEIGMRKPDTEIFEFVLADAGINADETLFIDDSYTNLGPAAKVGIKTLLLKPGERIENIDYQSIT